MPADNSADATDAATDTPAILGIAATTLVAGGPPPSSIDATAASATTPVATAAVVVPPPYPPEDTSGANPVGGGAGAEEATEGTIPGECSEPSTPGPSQFLTPFSFSRSTSVPNPIRFFAPDAPDTPFFELADWNALERGGWQLTTMIRDVLLPQARCVISCGFLLIS